MRLQRITSILDPRFVFRPDVFVKACVRKLRPRPDKILTKTSWGDVFEVDPHRFIGAHLYMRGVHEIAVCEALVRLADPGEFVADIGANIGVMTSILSRRVGKDGRVIAFEAHPAIAEKLRSNASRWLRNNIQIVEAAVSNVDGVLTMQDSGDASTNEGTAQISSNDSNRAEGRFFEVRAVSLDGQFHGGKFAVIKIDVEGHELAVLEGATRLLEQHAVRDIIFESTKHYPSLVHRFLLQHGFSVFRLESSIFGPKLIDPKEPSNGLELLEDFVATTEPKRALKRFFRLGMENTFTANMKIAMTTIPFLPQMGGMETVVALLARELVKLGCVVRVATITPTNDRTAVPYEVIRQPSRSELWRLFRWSDVYLQHGPSLKFGWPVFLGRKPAYIVHHIWMSESSGITVLGKGLRRVLLERCRNLAVSHALGKSLPVPWKAVPNPYDDQVFRLMPEISRNRDLTFLGRLEPLKGIGDLVDAFGILKVKGCEPTVTIVGSGSIKEELKAKVHSLGLSNSVQFTGAMQGEELAKILNAHRIMVLPSRWLEPFGIVALEGIACGCVVIGTSGGGLPEAIGPCGVTFPNGDAAALAEKIELLLSRPDLSEAYQRNAASHLARHQPAAVARKYLELLRAGSPA